MRRQLSNRTQSIGRLLVPILLAGVCGCSKTTKVTGNVTYEGRPVTYGSVILLSDDKIARSGVISSDGSYSVEGAPRGTMRIGVISRNPAKGRSVVPGRKPVSPGKKGAGSQETAVEGWFPLPTRFEAPETSGLTCTVDSSRVSHNIDLK